MLTWLIGRLSRIVAFLCLPSWLIAGIFAWAGASWGRALAIWTLLAFIGAAIGLLTWAYLSFLKEVREATRKFSFYG